MHHRRAPLPLLLASLTLACGLLAGCGSDSKDKSKSATAAREADVGGQVIGGANHAEMKSEAKRDGRPEPAVMSPAPAKYADDSARTPQRDTMGGTGSGKGMGEGKAVVKGSEKTREDAILRQVPEPEKAEKAKPKPPQVWHRDASRPTFARVYVGDKNSLELVSLHISVVVEGPRARTLVDHVFRNPHDKQLEGTFEYPLPAGASPSYYAMFLGQTRDAVPVNRFKPDAKGNATTLPEMLAPALLARQVDTADWGRLQEARIVPPERGREAYEEIVRGRIDPALLEYASGNTFRGRVFPIAPKGYNRVILAYEETLPVIDGRTTYRYSLPTCQLHELRFSLQADARECKDVAFQPKDARRETSADHEIFSRSWSDAKPGGEVIFTARPAEAMIQTASGKHGGGPVYFYSRLRPNLPEVPKAEPFARHAVFLLDTSLSESPDRFGVSMKLLRTILETDPEIEKFNVVAFNAGAAWLDPKGWIANTKDARDAALAKLDGVVLEGATDLSAALDKVADPGFAVEKGTPLSCFLLSDGHLTWGETDVAPLVARFKKRIASPARFFCYRTGLGEENAELFDALTRDGGGTFQCFGEAEVVSAAKAHRRQCLLVEKVRFEGSVSPIEVLVSGRRSAVYPGGELLVAGHTLKPGKGGVVVEGTFAGQKFSQTFPFEVREDGELAGRGWGEIAVASLLALNDPWVEELVTAYCQEFNIASRAGSFLVLENEADYKRFGLDEKKGKTISGELDAWLSEAWSKLAGEPSVKSAFGRLLVGIDGTTKVMSASDSKVKEVLGLLSEEDCALPEGGLRGAILLVANADKNYLHNRQKDRRAVDPYLEESARRREDDPDGAVRVLSSIIEEHAGRGDALRMVGYRLMDMGRPALAARLFERVLRQRPFEPHSYRDLARSLEESGRPALAALLYEAVLAGTWHGRFGDALKVVTREEYARSLRAGLRDGKLNAGQRAFFEKRLADLVRDEQPADLRVSITWNTDNTDIDLHVIEPDRSRVYYSQPKSRSGGELSQDQTQGYGPERYRIAKAAKGEYQLIVHYFRANPNLIGGETHVNVTITRFAGTEREKVERRTVILRRDKEEQTVARLRY